MNKPLALVALLLILALIQGCSGGTEVTKEQATSHAKKKEEKG